MEPLPLQAQTMFSDLRRLLIQIEGTDVRGSLGEKTVKGKTYLYDQVRVGDKVVQKALGPDSEEIRERAARSKDLQNAARNLVRGLVGQGCLFPERAIGAVVLSFARAGVFDRGALMIGTHAFRCYEGELGVRLSEANATLDVDFAMGRLINVAATDPSLPGILEGMGYAPEQQSMDPQACPWRWGKGELLVDFLTPDAGRKRRGRPQIEKLGVWAQPMRFLDYLLVDPIRVPVLYQGGVLATVPDPARYAVHKLIVAADPKRDRDKARKDRRQAEVIMEALSSDSPNYIEEALEDARSRGPAWRKALKGIEATA